MKKKYNIEITRSQMNVFIRALEEMRFSILAENNDTVPKFETSSYYIAERWQNKLMELKSE
jgi:hypothetical protein